MVSCRYKSDCYCVKCPGCDDLPCDTCKGTELDKLRYCSKGKKLMAVYPLQIAKGIVAPAYVMVPLLESEVDRAVFNGIARIVLGKLPVATQEDFDKVVKIKDDAEDLIFHELKGAPSVHVPPTNSECLAIEEYITKRLILVKSTLQSRT